MTHSLPDPLTGVTAMNAITYEKNEHWHVSGWSKLGEQPIILPGRFCIDFTLSKLSKLTVKS